MTATAAAYQLSQAEVSSDIKQRNLTAVAGALTLTLDLIDDLQAGKKLSAAELEFVSHARELADGVCQ